MGKKSQILLMLVLLLFSVSTAVKAEEVDLELVLAMDASGSISNAEYVLQLDGTAAAFRDPAIHAAISSGPTGKVAVNAMLWSDAAFAKVNTGWFVLDSPETANAFATYIQTFQLTEDNQIGFGGGGTGIGSGVEEALRLLNVNRQRGLRRIIDVSGDGVETEFWFSKTILIKDAKELANADSVIINGLPILTPDFPELDKYYKENVITGAGSFVETAESFEDFGRAIRKKLLREISSTISGLDLQGDNAGYDAKLLLTLKR